MPTGFSIETGLPFMLGKRNPHPNLRKRPYEWLLTKLKIRTKNKCACTLTYEEFLTFVNKKKCFYCGTELPWQPHMSTISTSSSYFLDRINNSQGYTVANCVPCCTVCNKTRSNIFTHEEMLKIGPFVRQIINQRNGISH